MEVKLNDVVMVYGYRGIVKHISPEKPTIIGIELYKLTSGNLYGIYDEKCLLQCKPYSTVYCPPTSIMKYTSNNQLLSR